jgi:hypothetical protein
MKGKNFKLYLALLLPILVLVMLKLFGRNQFDVPPLFVDDMPKSEACGIKVSLPYHVPDSVMVKLPIETDSLVCIDFGGQSPTANIQIQRAVEQFKNDPVHITSSNKLTNPAWKECIFFLQEPFDVVVVDRKGVIRGQYDADDREEMDRLITEITIILKKY